MRLSNCRVQPRLKIRKNGNLNVYLSIIETSKQSIKQRAKLTKKRSIIQSKDKLRVNGE